MKRITCAGAATLAAVILSGVSVQADVLDLPLFDSQDVLFGFIDVTYDAGTREFVADAFALTFDKYGGDSTENIMAGGLIIPPIPSTTPARPREGPCPSSVSYSVSGRLS